MHVISSAPYQVVMGQVSEIRVSKIRVFENRFWILIFNASWTKFFITFLYIYIRYLMIFQKGARWSP